MLDLRAGFKGCIKGSSTCFCVRILFLSIKRCICGLELRAEFKGWIYGLYSWAGFQDSF